MLSCFLKAAGFLYFVQCTIKYEGEEFPLTKTEKKESSEETYFFGGILVNLMIFTYKLGKVSGNSL